nr:MAG TPA: nonstructural protein [Caudoviricetes sp.]
MFLIATFTFETYYAFNFSEQSIVSTTSNVYTWIDVCTTLTVTKMGTKTKNRKLLPAV